VTSDSFCESNEDRFEFLVDWYKLALNSPDTSAVDP